MTAVCSLAHVKTKKTASWIPATHLTSDPSFPPDFTLAPTLPPGERIDSPGASLLDGRCLSRVPAGSQTVIFLATRPTNFPLPTPSSTRRVSAQ